MVTIKSLQEDSVSHFDLPSLATLKAFEFAGRLGGIRRAALALGISHAIVSRHVRTLEHKLGVLLLDRKSGRLTDTGTLYHGRIAAAIAEIMAATDALTAKRRGTLVIQAAPGLALHWLTARLSGFKICYPRLIVDLRASDAEPDFSNNELDGDVRYLRDGQRSTSSTNVKFTVLGRPPVFPVAAPDNGLVTPFRISDASNLALAPLIEEHDDAEWRLWFAAQGVDALPERPVARYGHAHLALAAARAGQGIALANHYLVAEDLAAGRLVEIQPSRRPFVPVALGAYVFRAERRQWDVSDLARFRRWLIAEFAKDLPR